MIRIALVVVLISSIPADAAPWDRPTRPAPTQSFAMLSMQAQAARANALAQSFPADWHAKVRVDVAGMPEEVELAVAIPAADAEARVAEIIRAHAPWFGIGDPTALHVSTSYGRVVVGIGQRWSGMLYASVQAERVLIYGHLWPITAEDVSTKPAEHVLEPFIGLKGSLPSRCNCGHDTVGFTTGRGTFELHGGMALVCADGSLRPRAAIAIRVMLGSVHNIPGLDKLPELVDAHTLEPIHGGYKFFETTTDAPNPNPFNTESNCWRVDEAAR